MRLPFAESHQSRYKMDSSHLSQSFITFVILLLWQMLHSTAQDIFQPGCFGDGSVEGDLLNYNIRETDPTGTTIGNIPLNGIADGPNATIELSFSEVTDANDYLSIDSENKTLVLAQRVDRDGPFGKSELTTTLLCQVLTGGFLYGFEYTIKVDVADINDNTPMFIGLPYEVSLSELTRTGTTVFRGFQALDADGESTRNGQVIYSIEPYAEDPNSDLWFTIRDAGRREITLERPLDYERKQQWQVLLQARDNGNPEFNYNYTVITINVLDGNDLPPIFVPCNATNITVEDCTGLTFTTTILERTPLTSPLEIYPAPIYAVDGDENVTESKPIFYSIYTGTPYNYADYLSINSTSGEVYLLQPVCYNDIQRFDLEIKASEGPLLTSDFNSSSFLEVDVLEFNDYPPEFNQTSYVGYVYENAPVGTQIKLTPQLQDPLKIVAFDRDMDTSCRTSLMYSLHDSSGSFILMEQEAGSAFVVTNTELDRETQSEYTIDVVAVEVNTRDLKESQPARVTVMIMDRNDNGPRFMPNQYSTELNRYKIEIRENHPTEAPVVVLQSTDPDTPASDWVSFMFAYVTNPSSGPPFGIQRVGNTSVAIVLEPGYRLERGESHVVSLQVTDGLDDSLKSPTAYVEIEVLRTNASHAPRFTQDVFTASASEGLPVGTFVTTVTATDSDEEDKLIYALIAGNEEGVFEVEPTSGDINLIKELDRETTPMYMLNVTVFDGNLTAYAHLQITVLDINDNNPQFNLSWPQTFVILEGMVDEFVGQVMAYDLDAPDTTNSEIKYGLISEQFNIDPEDGTITTKVALDREQKERYEVSVVAMDNAAAARSSNLMVTIIVQDINDNGPVFAPSEYTVEVEEESVVTNFITLSALDVDKTAVLEYSITVGDTSLFTVGKSSGKMSLLQPLDYELAQTHTVNVTVTDVEIAVGKESNSTATVVINVLDINDHRPIFTKTEYRGAVLRIADLATVVVDDIVANDRDMPSSVNGQVQYNLNPRNDLFTIPDPRLGIIVTKSSLRLAEESYNLTVIASDQGNPKNGAKAYVIIDVRVEKPIFQDTVLRVNSLMEGEPGGSHVVDVKAVANKGDKIVYSIISDSQDVFSIESIDSIGKIYTTDVLDREYASTYMIEVMAVLHNDTDNGLVGNQRRRRRRKRATDSNILEVIVELGDVNDNAPSFLLDKYFIGVSQDAGVSTTIITMEAYDMDSGNNSALTYSLSPTSASNTVPLELFSISSDSGIIATEEKLAMETEKKYEIVVIAGEKYSSVHDPASTVVSIALINNLYRAVVVGMVPPDLTQYNINAVEQTLEELLGAQVFVEDVSQRHYGKDLDQIDPSGSDTTFYAINTTTGLPLETEKIINNLEDNPKELNALYSSIASNGSWVETRAVGVGRSAVSSDSDPTIEAIALICLAIVLFVACVLAIIVIMISWKKRQNERVKQARVYLPQMYSGFNPYANTNNNEEMEMGNDNLDEGLFASANPVYFDDQSVQVTDELFPNGAPPNFLREAEIQEATMDFAPEESDEEANAAANCITAACVSSSSEKSSVKDAKTDAYPPSSGPPSYTSQENQTQLPNLLYDADSLPRKIPPSPNHRPPPPPPPQSHAPLQLPPVTPAKPPAYDNPGAIFNDEIDRISNKSPTTQPRTDSLPRDQMYSPSEEGSYQQGRGHIEPKELEDPSQVHLVKIYKPPPTFDSTDSSTTADPAAITNHATGNGVLPKSPKHTNGTAGGKKLPNGKAWTPEEVLTTAL